MPFFVPADGRVFTSYESPSVYNEFLQRKFGVKDSVEFKDFIQNNGQVVRDTVTGCSASQVSARCPSCQRLLNDTRQ